MDELIAALRAEAANYRKIGEHQIAKALEASADEKQLTGGLSYRFGITGVSQTSKETGRVYYRQYVPALNFSSGPRSESRIQLSSQLIQKFVWSPSLSCNEPFQTTRRCPVSACQ